MKKRIEKLETIQDLTVRLNQALQNLDEQTKNNLEANNLQVNGISMALQRVQIGIDKTRNDPRWKAKDSEKIKISRLSESV